MDPACRNESVAMQGIEEFRKRPLRVVEARIREMLACGSCSFAWGQIVKPVFARKVVLQPLLMDPLTVRT